MKRFLPLLFTMLLSVSCNETYIYEELSFDPNIVYSLNMDHRRSVDLLNSYQIKAKDEDTSISQTIQTE